MQGTVRYGDSEDRYKSVGLQCRHAYSILQIKTVVIDNNTSVNVMQLRNPWGKNSWNGDFGINSQRWTPSLRQQLGYYSNDHDSGVFWMTVQDWFYHFTSLYVCRTRVPSNNSSSSTSRSSSSSASNENWTEVRVRAPMRNVCIGKPMTRPTLPCFRVETVSSNTKLEVTMHQPSIRGNLDIALASIGFIIMKEHGKRSLCFFEVGYLGVVLNVLLMLYLFSFFLKKKCREYPG